MAPAGKGALLNIHYYYYYYYYYYCYYYSRTKIGLTGPHNLAQIYVLVPKLRIDMWRYIFFYA